MFHKLKQFHFSAAHQLDLLPDNHPCSRTHGHNYIVEVVQEVETLDESGFVVDYYELAPITAFISNELDHRKLNEILSVPTSAENIARFLYKKFNPLFPTLTMVRVSETPKTWAEFTLSPS